MQKIARVLVLYTGGTVGMRKGPRGYQPEPGHLVELLERLPQFHDPAFPRLTTPPTRLGTRVQYQVKEYVPLLDSSNMGMEDWARIALDIEQAYAEFDAFVVLHGTDTMAYSASALSFMLENLGKTVILTGSQIPLGEARSDGMDNLLGALSLAGDFEIPEVCLFFHHRLLRGNRTRKYDASSLDAFVSGSYPALVELGVDIEVKWDLLLPAATGPLSVDTRMEPSVAALRIFPGITQEILANFLRPPLRALVLETYGSGNAPDRRLDFLETLAEATRRGVLIVNCTQCYRGTVRTDYAAGVALAEAGVIGGADMTTEAALTKVSSLLGRGLEGDELQRAMRRSLRGELTEPSERPRFTRQDLRRP